MLVRLTIFFTIVLFTSFLALKPAYADKRFALLIGISKYPSLDKHQQLDGPANDVVVLNRMLIKQGFDKSDITILASGSWFNQPKRARILSELKRLSSIVAKGDFVYIHYSGHGTQVPTIDNREDEPDGRDEYILAQDVGRWKNDDKTIPGGIRDNELGKYINAIREKGAFVFLSLDSCYAGTMLRGAPAPDVRTRQVNPLYLGVPRNLLFPSTANRKEKFPSGKERPSSGQAKTKKLAGFVAFYAAQSFQPTIEMKIPARGKNSKYYGLFSFTLAQLLSARSPMSYRQLAQAILQKYAAQNHPSPTPLFEGTDLDEPVLGQAGDIAKKQWPITFQEHNAGKRSLWIDAGSLQEIGVGSRFAVLPSPTAGLNAAYAFAQAEIVEPFRANLTLFDDKGKPFAGRLHLARASIARLLRRKFTTSKIIALPRMGDAVTKRERRVYSLLKGLAKRATTNPKAGRIIKWVAAGEPADQRLAFSPAGKGSCARDQLWFLSGTGQLICRGARKSFSYKLGKPDARFETRAGFAIYRALRSIAKLSNLERLADMRLGGQALKNVSVSMAYVPKGKSDKVKIPSVTLPSLKAGDKLDLEVHNGRDEALDLTVLFVDSRYGMQTLFPKKGYTNRIAPGASYRTSGRITADTRGLERFLIIASPAQNNAQPIDYSFLSQLALPDQLRNAASDAAIFGTLDLDLVEAAFGHSLTRGSRSRAPSAVKTMMRSLRWVVE